VRAKREDPPEEESFSGSYVGITTQEKRKPKHTLHVFLVILICTLAVLVTEGAGLGLVPSCLLG
jgi:hypothetical protein